MLELVIKFVEQAREPAVLDPMMGVPQKLLYVQSGDIANVLHTNQEIQSVDLALIIMEVKVEKQQPVLEYQEPQKLKQLEVEEEQQEEVKQLEVEQMEVETLLGWEGMGTKFVEQAKEPAVLDPMMGVLQKLLCAQSGDIVSVQHTNLEIQNVVLALIIMEVEKQQLVLEDHKQQKLKQLEGEEEQQEEVKQLEVEEQM